MDSSADPSPLAGARVVVTRPLRQADELCWLLEACGAEVLKVPVLEIQPPGDPALLDDALRRLAAYHWVIFTSVNAVERTAQRLRELSLPSLGQTLPSLQVCAIGPATAKALEMEGCHADLVPDEYIAESVVAAFCQIDLKDAKVLIPRAAAARDVVPDALRERGAQVDTVEAYRSGVPADAASRIAQISAQGIRIDWVTFTSGSTVKNFLAAGGAPLLADARVATIGPATTEVARKHGLNVDAEAAQHTAAGLVAAILSYTRLRSGRG